MRWLWKNVKYEVPYFWKLSSYLIRLNPYFAFSFTIEEFFEMAWKNYNCKLFKNNRTESLPS